VSWPTDGLPRFIVVEIEGSLGISGRDNVHDNITCTILDRAYCHREIRSWRSEDQRGRGKGRAKAEARRFSGRHCDTLNQNEGAVTCEITTYIGYQLTVTDTYITVEAPNEKRVGVARTMTEARRFAREHRKALRAAS
jgi:hypothetical protein